MEQEGREKTYIVSVNLIIALLFCTVCIMGLAGSRIGYRIAVLEEKVGFLEDHDWQNSNLKHNLFEEKLKS